MTSVEGPDMVTSLDVPGIVIVVVTPSKTTTVEVSAIETEVTTSSNFTTVDKLEIETVVSIVGRVGVVDIDGRVTTESEPFKTVKTVDVEPKYEENVESPSVVSRVDEAIDVVVVLSAPVPNVHVLVSPMIVTSVVAPSVVDVSTVSGVSVDTVTSSAASCLA